MAEKRFYWLKMPHDFLDSMVIKKLRSIPGGDQYTIIALKILLLGTTADNRIYYEGIEESFAKEIALTINENAMATEMVVNFLIAQRWIIRKSKYCYLVSKAAEMTGSESEAAERKRRSREKAKLVYDCDNVTEMSQDCHNLVTEKENKKSSELPEIQFVAIQEDNECVCDNVTEMSQSCHEDVTTKEKKDEKKKNIQESISSSLRSEEDTKEVPKNRDVAELLPSWLGSHGLDEIPELRAVLNDFAEMRKKIRKPLTRRALELNLDQAWKLSGGDTGLIVRIFEQSIQNSWSGVFALKNQSSPATRGGKAGFSVESQLRTEGEEVSM